jgi:hypothetical protein
VKILFSAILLLFVIGPTVSAEDDNWVTVKSEPDYFKVSFSIDMPCQPSGKEPFECFLPSGVAYRAIQIHYPDDKSAEKAYIEFSNNSLARASNSSQSNISGVSQTAELNDRYLQTSYSSPSICDDARMLRSGVSNILMTVFAKNVKCDSIKVRTLRFFDSLVIEK